MMGELQPSSTSISMGATSPPLRRNQFTAAAVFFCAPVQTSAGAQNSELSLRCSEGLLNVSLNVGHIFEADGQPDVIRGHTGFFLFGSRQLLVRRGSRMNHQTLGVADVRKKRQQLHRVDEFFAGFQSTFDAEADDAAIAALQILRSDRMVRIEWQTGISHP